MDANEWSVFRLEVHGATQPDGSPAPGRLVCCLGALGCSAKALLVPALHALCSGTGSASLRCFTDQEFCSYGGSQGGMDACRLCLLSHPSALPKRRQAWAILRSFARLGLIYRKKANSSNYQYENPNSIYELLNYSCSHLIQKRQISTIRGTDKSRFPSLQK